jgi:catechol 2,3-dioxygenase-like lactoylglutathione lyase family enzyme
MRVHELDHIVLNVSDIARAVAWYSDMLGLAPERLDEWRRGDVPFPSVRINDRCVIDLLATERSGENMNHLCVVVDRGDVDAIASDSRFDLVGGPVQRWGARGDGTSVYVRDPDGNLVELRSYD